MTTTATAIIISETVEYDVNISRQHHLNGTITIGDNVLLAKHVFIDYVNIKFDKNYAAEDVTLRYIESSSEGKISYYLDDGRETINLGSNLPTEVAELFRCVNSLTETPLTVSGMHEKLAKGNKAYALGSNVYSLLDTNVSARKLKLDVNNKELREANENLVNSYNESIGEAPKGKSK